jgi:hypothetical protein
MAESLEQVISNIEARLTRVELYLPGLATREELRAAVAPLATREEMRAEAEASRRHATLLFEDLHDDNRIILEHLLSLSARVDALAQR